MERLRRLCLILPLFLAALPPLSPQSYFVTEEQLATLEKESAARKEELERQRTLLAGLNQQLQALGEQLRTSEEELASSREALAESRKALQEAQESLKRYAGKSLRGKILAGAVSLVAGVAGGIVAGYFIGK